MHMNKSVNRLRNEFNFSDAHEWFYGICFGLSECHLKDVVLTKKMLHIICSRRLFHILLCFFFFKT